MKKFKIGDEVEISREKGNNSGASDVQDIKYGFITDENSLSEWCVFTKNGEDLADSRYIGWFQEHELSLLKENVEEKKSSSSRFILQYELDEDPFEFFETMREVETRIKELSERTDLKKESIKVYEIARVIDVKLSTKVSFVNQEAHVNIQPEKKIGRPVGSKNKKTKPKYKFEPVDSLSYEVGGMVVTVKNGKHCFHRIESLTPLEMCLRKSSVNYKYARHMKLSEGLQTVSRKWSEVVAYIKKPVMGNPTYKRRLEVIAH